MKETWKERVSRYARSLIEFTLKLLLYGILLSLFLRYSNILEKLIVNKFLLLVISVVVIAILLPIISIFTIDRLSDKK